MLKSKKFWKPGDVFAITTNDDQFAVGQILGQEPDIMSSVTVALFDERYKTSPEVGENAICEISNLYAILYVSLNHLKSKDWPVVANKPIKIDVRDHPFEKTRSQGFIGAKVYGSGIVTDFVNAFYGLTAWDDWNDPSFLDSLLISESVKPTDRLIYKK